MSVVQPELEVITDTSDSLHYLEHGWPDPLCRWHAHKECELHLILATHGKSFVGDYIGDFMPGSLFLTGPYLPHNWITDDLYTDKIDTRDMVIQFDADRIASLTAAFPEFREVNGLIEDSQSGLEFFDFDTDFAKEKLAEVRDTTGPARVMVFLELLVALAAHKDRKALSVLKLVQPEGNSKQARIVEVIDHIVENFADEISVEMAAKMAGMSAATFSRNFQAVTGNRFVQFVNRVRIGEACGMLYVTDQPVTSICYQVGFQNLANFNRHFLKMKGMTPSAYRETARKDLVKKLESA